MDTMTLARQNPEPAVWHMLMDVLSDSLIGQRINLALQDERRMFPPQIETTFVNSLPVELISSRWTRLLASTLLTMNSH